MLKNTLFEDTATAFVLKSDSQLERAYFLFKMIASEPLVKIGTAATNFALKVNLPVEGLIRSTVFDHFCGGVNENDCLPVIDKLFSKGVSSVLDYSVEGKETEEQFNNAMQKVVDLINFSENNDAMPIAVFKPTGFGRFYIYEKISAKETLTAEEQSEWERVINRFDVVCKAASEKQIKVLIDAEESWMQKAADDLVEEMMIKYNKEQVIVYNTLQTYRWDRLDYLKQLHKKSINQNFKIGFKIVRGAYMEKERERAKEQHYASPICKDKNTTDSNFDACMDYMLKNRNEIGIFIGTHNEASTYKALEFMTENSILNNDKNIWFGQLYGMSDHISFNLAKESYNVAKYIPFGPVKDVMPYLIRRAEENTSVAGQTSRELNLIKSEKQRRKL